PGFRPGRSIRRIPSGVIKSDRIFETRGRPESDSVLNVTFDLSLCIFRISTQSYNLEYRIFVPSWSDYVGIRFLLDSLYSCSLGTYHESHYVIWNPDTDSYLLVVLFPARQ